MKNTELIINKYLKEIKELEVNCIDVNNNIKDEYKDSLEQLILNISNNCISELSEYISVGYNPNNYQYRSKLLNYNVLWEISDELGYQYSCESFKSATNNNWIIDANTRLFMMFVKTFKEIIYLLEGGYAACALSRIRYIYEIGVFLNIINKGSNEMSKKFILISQKSRIDIINSINKYNADATLKASLDSIASNIQSSLDNLGYGNDIKKNYNWAKEITGLDKISFKELSEYTSLKDYYYIYVKSCHIVHADIFGSVFAIDLTKEEIKNHTWVTTPSINGTDKVLKYLNILISNIFFEYFGKKPSIFNVFIASILKNILTKDNKKCSTD